MQGVGERSFYRRGKAEMLPGTIDNNTTGAQELSI
jgi:hypothetical protein